MTQKLSPEEIAAQKTALRAEILQQLRAMDPEDRAARSATICQRIFELRAWQNAMRILLFSPMRTEPDIRPLEAAAEADEKASLVIPTTLRHEHELELTFTPDLVIVPGLAFSRDRHRMGRGGGFYDRLLAGRARDACKIGVCFALQVRDAIPHAEHDVILDEVISA